MKWLLEPERLGRVGRGRQLEFYATDRDVETWLLESLPERLAPYTVITEQNRLDGQRVVSTLREASLSDTMATAAAETIRLTHRFWIRSHALHPERIDLSSVTDLSLLHLNGLPYLDHGARRPDGRLAASCLQHLPEVVDLRRGLKLAHDDYASVFRALRHRIRRSLTHLVTIQFPSGKTWTSESNLMTDDAAFSHEGGRPYDAQPVVK